MDILKKLAEELNIKVWQAEAVVGLIDEGNTIPFIARYRKEAHGALNDEVLRNLDERLRYLRTLEERRQTILSTIEEQGKLTEELRAQIEAAETSVGLEDLYRPYKPKRRTRAMIAREKGLEPLALYLRSAQTPVSPEKKAEEFVDPENGVDSVKTALSMAMDIIAEEISDNAEYRKRIRDLTFEKGLLSSEAKDPEAKTVYENYYEYQEAVRSIPGHRILALNRGEKEKILTVKVIAPVDEIHAWLDRQTGADSNPATAPYMTEAVRDAYKRLIAPSIENEIRSELTEKAQEGAIKVFGSKVLDTRVIYPTAPQNRVDEAKAELAKLIRRYKIDLISVGNGTASRESEAIIADFIRETHLPVQYVIVNEAGASVYSASKLATEEFPEFDVGQRSAASIARRLQDPLAELVKIDPKAIGVGQYQHDMNQARLSEALTGVVEDSVNSVGVDVNTASAALLGFVSGVNKTIAKNIVAYRESNGAFRSRRELLKVPKLGPKAFEQSAGFLRIRDGAEPLDMTGVHPESYNAAKKLLIGLGYSEEDIRSGRTRTIAASVKEIGAERVAREIGLGEFTLNDIISELEKPGRDPRENVPGPVLRSDVMDMKDLTPGMRLKGTVRNIVDFGAFVDIGVHQDGLVHLSQLSDRYVSNPLDVVKVGDIVDVRVLSVDMEKGRIALTMKSEDSGEDRPGTGKQAGSDRKEKSSSGSRDRRRKPGAGQESGRQNTRKGQARSGGDRTRKGDRTGERRRRDPDGPLTYNPFADLL